MLQNIGKRVAQAGALDGTMVLAVIYNRLRVFRTANTAHLGRGVGQERWLHMGPSEKDVAY